MILSQITRFWRHREGVASIEFAMAFFGFFVMILFVAEIARLSYMSAVVDLAVSEAAKEAKNAKQADSSAYQARFQTRLVSEGGRLWRFLSKEDAIKIQVNFANSISDLLSNNYSASAKNSPLARYHLQYDYHPMFFPFPGVWADTLLNREVIFVQEYERSAFVN
ncbi:TadE/TadG family type IV pilus assembly protein [Pragia fontium]|uniref:TadE/TadG family type IV pilus assembly protein n=1 Tax=Pragia fontium TaxID=82985 RepID=UPI000649A9FB|nr:TadE/TadG family type IV pilus assembly protein [Pragia fontium]AKJ41127.1 pilus assembly protein TadE [Pragia fontium]